MPAPTYSTRHPAIEDLRRAARRRIPRFAFEYLDGGCNEDVNLGRNTSDLRKVELEPRYLAPHGTPDLGTELFGHRYSAPYGIAPIGLQGLIWPGSPEILARAANLHNLPFVLSTVSTLSIERASELTEGRAWFQLYHPAEDRVRDDLLQRAAAAGAPVLVLLCDVPSFGFRPRDIRNGLAMPPRSSLRNLLQILARPAWAWRTLRHGRPRFENLLPYMPETLDLAGLGQFMDQTFAGRLDPDKIAAIRDRWQGRIVLKGVASCEDVEQAIQLGIDGVIVSNHGGRQLDAGQSAIAALRPIVKAFAGRIPIMMDSGLRSGPDVARTLSSGAAFCFLGRTFMYSVAALGDRGGDHAAELLRVQLQQVMEQLGCDQVTDLPRFLVDSPSA